MKHRPKNRPHARKAKQRLFKELERAEKSLEDSYPCQDPYAVPEEPTVEDMLENNLPDR